jgi:hypothetical protein
MTSLQPGILPGLPDQLQALHFTLVAALTCGLGFLAGARRIETAFFTGWGIGCLVFVAAGGLSQAGLAQAAFFLALSGAAGLVTRFWRLTAKTLRGGQDADAHGMAWRVLALALPTLLILLSLRTTAYDDFSFWAPNLVALCLTGHFPTLAHPLTASFMPGYPRGVALSGYATWLLGPDPSPAGKIRLLATGPWWNFLVMLAASAALAENLAARFRALGQALDWQAFWALAALAILLQSFLNPGFISKMTFSNMGDGATGSGFAMLTALLFEFFTGQRKRRIIIEMAFTAAAIVFIRQDNFAILFIWALGAVCGLLLCGKATAPGGNLLSKIFWLTMAAFPALLVWLIWSRYTAAQIPGGDHSLLAVRDWHWADYPATLRAAGSVLLSKGVYTLLAIGFGIAFLAALTHRGFSGKGEKLLLCATTILIYGNAAFIMFTYLTTSFTQVEVRTAVTFWRFLAQTAPAEMVALGCLMPLPLLSWLRGSASVTAAICLITALLPLALADTPFTFRTDLRFQAPPYLAIGQSLAKLLPQNAKLLLVDNSDGSGYIAWIIKFGLLELGGGETPVEISLAPLLFPNSQARPDNVPAGSYVLVTQSPWRPPYFLNTSMPPWHAYLFQGHRGGLILLKVWPIPPYGRKY